jgi:hypothetical protein
MASAWSTRSCWSSSAQKEPSVRMDALPTVGSTASLLAGVGGRTVPDQSRHEKLSSAGPRASEGIGFNGLGLVDQVVRLEGRAAAG